MFFFEKKNQKTFATFGRSRTLVAVSDSERQLQKFFGSFFQKRTSSLYLYGNRTNMPHNKRTRCGSYRPGKLMDNQFP